MLKASVPTAAIPARSSSVGERISSTTPKVPVHRPCGWWSSAPPELTTSRGPQRRVQRVGGVVPTVSFQPQVVVIAKLYVPGTVDGFWPPPPRPV